MVIKFDHTAGVYELFTDRGEWRGAFDTHADAMAAERNHPANLAEKAALKRARAILQGRRLSEGA